MNPRNKVIELIAEKENMTISQLAQTLGKPANSLYDIQKGKIKGISEKLADLLLQKFPYYNKTWLMTGEGDMLKASSSVDSQPSVKNERVTDDEAYKVPLVPISALGGSLNDFNLAVKRDDCETVISPIKDIDMAIKISGDSMEPEYPSDSQVFVKKVNERAFLEWGRVYVLNTCNGIVIKRLMPTNDPNTVLCESINPKYPPFEVNLENVNGVYRVIMCMSFK
jgi:phage repressor protein C with HTH and peptisase S24 domain